ncbi:MAG: response regulator [Campylobacterota bacterium]|nr:response regulator [Campylobacterota bacterium]
MEIKELYNQTKDLTILYAEDDDKVAIQTIEVLEDLFKDVTYAKDGLEALEFYKNKLFDIVITDLNMPKMDGQELIINIKQQNPKQTIIVVSAYSDSQRLINLLQSGVDHFILKPIKQEYLNQVLFKAANNIAKDKKLQEYQEQLELTNMELVSEVWATQKISIETIANMVEKYDSETGNHVKRIEKYTALMIDKIPEKHKDCPAHLREYIPFASILHDIGKMYIPKDILNKPAKLDFDEFETMKTHAYLGGKMLLDSNETFKKQFGKDSFLKVAGDIAMYHHEKYDGSGYSKGLKAKEIPMCAKIVSLVDVYDALRCDRVYKKGWTQEDTVEYIKNESGKSFDPIVVDIFLNYQDKFNEVFLEIK